MIANVNSSTATQNNSAVQQANNPSPTHSGISFTDILSNEIHATAPLAPHASSPSPSLTVPNSSGSGPSTFGTNNSGTFASGDTNSTSGSNTVNPVGKKNTKPQAGAQTNPAAEATAATLASIASRVGETQLADTSAVVDDNTVTVSINTSAQNAAAAANSVTPGQVRDFSSEIPLTDTQGNVAGLANGNAIQTAIAVNPALTAQGQNVAQQPSEFAAMLDNASHQESTDGAKMAATSLTSGADASPANNAPSSDANLVSSLTTNLVGANNTLQTLKSTNQDLSASQINAIAPVLNMPTSNLAAATPTATIAPQVGSSAWDQAIGQKINWMVSGNQQSASLTLNPPELGPLQVVLSINNQHANATFTSHQPEVRAALENAIPKLREMLGQSGIQLGECNVNSQPRQEFTRSQANSSRNTMKGTVSAGTAISSISSLTQRSGVGLVDTFV